MSQLKAANQKLFLRNMLGYVERLVLIGVLNGGVGLVKCRIM